MKTKQTTLKKENPNPIKPKLSDFTFGIESENYVRSWRCDHQETHETVSKIFHNYNGVLIYMRNMVERHKDDEEFWLHSFPEDKESSCSAHIHFKCNIPEWNTYKYDLYKRLFKLVKLFNFFFKNSPDKDEKIFSRRHLGDWCELITIPENNFHNSGRQYRALTLNPQYDTLEFRYNEVPKHLNQLSLFYYLLRIAIEDNIEIPELKDRVEINDMKCLNHMSGKDHFSYRNKESIRQYKTSYLNVLKDFVKNVSEKLNIQFYDFNNNRYSDFYGLITNLLDNDLKEFNKFFTSKMTERDWSENLKSKFYKPIKKELIKES